MEIEPISSTTSTSSDLWLDLWGKRLQARSDHADQSATEAPPIEVDAPAGDGVDVELSEHPGTGAQVVQLVDSDSGQVISEIPHRQVLDLVADLIQQNEAKQRGGDHDGQH